MTKEKEELAKQAGLNPEEAEELFSEDTLETIGVNPIDEQPSFSDERAQVNCNGAFCAAQCGCSGTPPSTTTPPPSDDQVFRFQSQKKSMKN
jgi:hypothetical protein